MNTRASQLASYVQIADIEPPITWAILGIVVFGTSVILFNQFANDIDWYEIEGADGQTVILISAEEFVK